MRDLIKQAENWYEQNYQKSGVDFQRRYPNEEFVRFLGRNFFSIPKEKRKNIHILELGCGTCANLWVVAREGFNAYGIDISIEAIKLSKKVVKNWEGSRVELNQGSMTEIPFNDNYFDAVIDVFSAYCLIKADFRLCLKEVSRVLKPGGKFFSYSPGKESDSYKNIGDSKMIDDSTLNGITRKDSPYPQNNYPFRFISPEEYSQEIKKVNMFVKYLEIVNRSYNERKEIFEFVTIETVKAD